MVTRRKFSGEFKREAVVLARSAGKPISHVAYDLGINVHVLGRGCREMEKEGAKAFRGQGISRDEELTRLKRELLQVKKERDFLKEAAAFFAKGSKEDTG